MLKKILKIKLLGTSGKIFNEIQAYLIYRWSFVLLLLTLPKLQQNMISSESATILENEQL